MANEFKVKNGVLTPNVILQGSTSGTTTIVATAIAGTTTLTLPAATDTLVGKATTDTLTNKTLSSVILTGSLTAGGSTGTNGQVLSSTGTGLAWVAAGATSSSAIFAANAQSDLGFVTDLTITLIEDLLLVTGPSNPVYNLGLLAVDGIVSLTNLDQSVKADYVGYSIIFGF
jgi:hypothetical protein